MSNNNSTDTPRYIPAYSLDVPFNLPAIKPGQDYQGVPETYPGPPKINEQPKLPPNQR
jgi:hypothetical protein